MTRIDPAQVNDELRGGHNRLATGQSVNDLLRGTRQPARPSEDRPSATSSSPPTAQEGAGTGDDETDRLRAQVLELTEGAQV